MKCVFCKIGETRPQRVTAEKYNEAGELVALIENFPADVCAYCGAEYYQAADWAKVDQLLADAKCPVTMAHIPKYALSA
jgi:YgiT-type zinc finger domain-containing protein